VGTNCSDGIVVQVGLLCCRNNQLFHLYGQASLGWRFLRFERDDMRREHLSGMMCDVKSILRLGGGSKSKGFLFTAERSVHISESVELIHTQDFKKCTTLCEVTFSSDSH
jgi:hypothetical protein